MTEGDIKELITLAGLCGLAFTISKPLPVILALIGLTLNMVGGRLFIFYAYEHAWLLCTLVQVFLAGVLVTRSQTFLSLALGGLYSGMIIGGGLTLTNHLSPNTGIGITLSYWSVMSVLTYVQFVVVTMYILADWHKNGLGNWHRSY